MLTMLLLAVAAAPAPAAVPDPCALLTRAEVAVVQGEDVREARASRRTEGALAIDTCLWTLPTYSRSVAVEVATAERDTIDAVWTRTFHRERRDQEREGKGQRESKGERGGKREEARPRRIRGLGRESFWTAEPPSGALYVRTGRAWFRISTGGPARSSDTQRKMTDLARKVLRRL
jgi:hypothetical protein